MLAISSICKSTVTNQVLGDRYLVVSVQGAWCNIKKFRGSQFYCKKYPTNNPSDGEEEDDSPPPSTSSHPAMVIPREISVSPDRDFDNDEDRDFEPPLQPEEEQEDSPEPHERTTNRHTEDAVTNPPRHGFTNFGPAGYLAYLKLGAVLRGIF